MTRIDIEAGLWERYLKAGHDIRYTDVTSTGDSKMMCVRCNSTIRVTFNRHDGYTVTPDLTFLDVACTP